MTLSDIEKLIEVKVVAGQNYADHKVDFAFASDLMSDVLTLEKDNLLLITGLANIQSIRTAEMSDIPVVILARNKKASPEMISLADELNIILMECKWSLFRLAGELYKAGVRPVF